ncbi:MAG: sugar-binding protein [Armatimonadota bacterium]
MRHIIFLALALVLIAAGAWAAEALPGKAVPAGAITPVNDQAAPAYHVQKAAKRPAIDGKADEWKNVPAMVLDQQEQARGWNGPQDLRGALRLQWDDQGLYFCLEVADDVHSAPKADADWWENDCCQFAFDAYLNGPTGGFDADEQSYLVGDSPKGPIFSAYQQAGQQFQQETLLKDRPLKMGVQPDGTRVFEWSMTWPQLAPVSPWLLGRCGFTFTINDNDGKGFEGAMFWSKGLIYGQNASQFGQIVFDGAQGSKPAALGLRPEVKVADDATGRWLHVAGAEPWNAARLLVNLPDGGKVTAKAAVYPVGEKKPVAAGSLTEELQANVPVAFTWDLSGLADGAYEVEYTVEKVAKAPQRVGFFQVNIDGLRAKREALRKQFGLDRPWDPMASAPALVRRHRGMVATALQLLDEATWAEAMKKADTRDEQIKTLANFSTMLDALQEEKDYLAMQRGIFMSAYFSVADGSGQRFVVSLPSNYSPRTTYPLIVHLHGAGGVPGPRDTAQYNKQNFILVMPWGRGATSNYRGLGEDDVLQVIAHMKEWYRIDPERVYVTGASMGGGGSWRMASRYPDLFAAAAPMCGYTNEAPIENLRNVPLFNQHGGLDWVVPVAQSRYAIRKLQEWGYPVMYKEIPESGHGISGIYPANDWMLELRRQTTPKAVTFTTRRPDPPFNRAYWATIRQFVDPHRKASINAQTVGVGAQQSITMTTDNVAVLELDVKQMQLRRNDSVLLQINGEFIEYKYDVPERLFLVANSGKGWTILTDWQPPVSTNRPYRAGGAANLYTGEPLMIVYGTQCADERKAAYRKAAEDLAGFNGSGSSYEENMPAGRIPIKADREVTAEDLEQYNLIILGGANDNALTSLLQSRLPITINEKNELIAGGRKPLNMDGGRFSLLYYNPLSPKRLVYLLAFDAKNDLKELEKPRLLLSGVWGDELGDAEDCYAWSLAGQRNLQFTDNWQWLVLPGTDRAVPAAFYNPRKKTMASLKVMQSSAKADFAIDLIGKDLPDFEVKPQDHTVADLAIGRSPLQTMVGFLTGEELLTLQTKAPEKTVWVAYPALDAKTIDPRQTYKVVFPTGITWSLARANQLNPRDPRQGPDIPQAELLTAVDLEK